MENNNNIRKDQDNKTSEHKSSTNIYNKDKNNDYNKLLDKDDNNNNNKNINKNDENDFTSINNDIPNKNKITSQFIITKHEKLHFIILIILCIFISIFKVYYNNKNNLIYKKKKKGNNNLNIVQMIFFNFINSPNFFFSFSVFYNILFLLIIMLMYIKKNNITRKRIQDFFVNMKNKLNNQNEHVFYFINNAVLCILFMGRIFKSYIISMFLINLFHDILHNYLIGVSMLQPQKVVLL
ncbi:hypothetical protein PFAG_04697 [Plasmodium falciparum Santa Lucia]|nr:hypothetical protein PFFVO_00297 [Plasmodium falciparum Vietnam Oak-Knoll (FVO)]ETW28035.1 hypothetical protein PFFCH_04593 [Plasmodium falciparum FCH/4]ETW38995.1 hypothetical protein PFTANZ_00339 [Plasmodium falciparum Tanzania (2000708)]ETW45410.1 hypothetical protein PFNF135_00331 [Plasmodium falciparum NF135/5.C10]EUR79080.1 hypothetical protein PFBG_00570 [Plasmodium falciparum 7G8]EUT80057.1 hypothetical protein PFAG_04697 [Plasmodium falciparum Santa Lucia]EWC89684.1 hypothetical p